MQSLRLLVIDDLHDDFELALGALRLAGIEVTGRRVEKMSELEHALEEREWDLCLLDWVLPALTAPEVIRVLKASRQPELQFIVWSGRNDAKVAFIAKEVLGAIEFLAKAEMMDRLPQLVRGAVAVLREEP